MENIAGAIIVSIIAIVCLVLSYLQFKEKGFLTFMLLNKSDILWIKSHTINNRE